MKFFLKFAYFVMVALLPPSLWGHAATIQSAQMTGVWAATGASFRATLELQGAQDLAQRTASRGGQRRVVTELLLTFHHVDQPEHASFMAPQQAFSVVDVGLDTCEITYYQAVAISPNGT